MGGYLTQDRAPILEALERMKRARLVPFDVPGHKRGRGNPELRDFLGEKCLDVDVNSMKMLDNLCHPVSVIRDAEKLAAEAFGAAHAFFMVGGTTSAVQAMVLTAVGRGDKIIMPRNVHRSAINALILCGAVPVYVNPQMDHTLGISLGMRVEEVKDAIRRHPDAKAVLANNPTYYGICSNLREIVRLAHEHGMMVLADEAHSTHFYFNDKLPVSAMAAGADMASISMHKSGGSLTQSSMLLCGPNVNAGYVHQVINITQTTSGSYLLLSSLDISRRNLALHGQEIFDKVIRLVEYARDEINAIGDYYAYSRELINGDSVYDFDTTKLSIFTRPTGTTSRRSSATSRTSWPTSQSATARRTSSASSRRSRRSGATTARIPRRCSRPSTSSRRSSTVRRRHSTPRRSRCPSSRQRAASAVSSSCATRRASRSSRRASASRTRS